MSKSGVQIDVMSASSDILQKLYSLQNIAFVIGPYGNKIPKHLECAFGLPAIELLESNEGIDVVVSVLNLCLLQND